MTKVKEQQLDLLSADRGNFGHGGARSGAGRKKGTGSKLIRVPTPLVEEVEALIRRYKETENE